MGSHPLAVQRRTLARGDAGVFGQEALDRIAAQAPAVQAWEQRLVGFATPLAEPDTQHRRRLHGERRDTLLPTFAAAAHVRTGVETHVGDPQAERLGDTQPRLRRQDEPCMVTSTESSRAVRGRQQSIDLVRGEEADIGALGPFGGNGEDALDQMRVLGVGRPTSQAMALYMSSTLPVVSDT